jgi:hypothetical protein
MFADALEDMFDFGCFIPVELFMVINYIFHLFDVLGISLDSLAEIIVCLFAELEVFLLLFSGLTDIGVEISDHLLNVHANCIDILVLDLNFFRDSLT